MDIEVMPYSPQVGPFGKLLPPKCTKAEYEIQELRRELRKFEERRHRRHRHKRRKQNEKKI